MSYLFILDAVFTFGYFELVDDSYFRRVNINCIAFIFSLVFLFFYKELKKIKMASNKEVLDGLLIYTSVLPMLTLNVLGLISTDLIFAIYISAFAYLGSSWLAGRVVTFSNNSKYKLAKVSSIMILVVIIFLTINIYYSASIVINFSAENIYSNRRELTFGVPNWINYVNGWIVASILPAIIVINFSNKKIIPLLLGFGGCIGMFFVTNQKAVLFYPLFSLLLYKACTKRNPLASVEKYLSIFFVIGIALILICKFFIKDSLLSQLLLNPVYILERVFLAPSRINTYYFDFYGDGNFVAWANSKLNIFSPEYNDRYPAEIIGLEYFGNELTWANAGWMGSGYMQFGTIGILLYAIGMGLISGALQKISLNNRNYAVMIGVVTPSIVGMYTSSDFTVALITGGVLLSSYIAFIIGRSRD